jgi:hypothetical protein
LFLRGTTKVALSWFEYVDGAGYRAYTGCEQDGAACKAPQPIGPPMAHYQLGPRSPRWIGSQSVLVTDDKRRRRHALWTQVLGEGDGGTARIVWSTAAGR